MSDPRGSDKVEERTQQSSADPNSTVRRYVLSAMRSSDVPEVSQLERRCFSNPWPESAYYRELREPERNYYVVLRWETARSEEEPELVGATGTLARLLRAARPARTSAYPLVGFAGMWVIYGEAHVTTIGVAPEHRGLGLGEVLFLTLISEAIRRGAEFVTLEVRVSNVTAQSLYAKYGFTRRGVRPRYYSDNLEDAYIMTSPPLRDPTYRQELVVLRNRLLERLAAEGIEIVEEAA
ncbi:ribosomal protein S18-alanine N-acetyltransferase [Thermomicrobium sp.]|uniref:ribosomal protein S18-alanine N-acetyltransferase n=1 Tax=Thermomicrobium sp. TaxID=1969469 RepID=UPI001B049547|nr:ribosomal protein S18-alanine N-acetyltransferase [Thermomicrobium sp.]MBO9306030.1 ribosomal protein S18-alanine N-acetyltransferase [Thermomicrobium sp.]